MIGSHIDSVPNGGWLDGALGVMGALETLRALAAAGTAALHGRARRLGRRGGRPLRAQPASAPPPSRARSIPTRCAICATRTACGSRTRSPRTASTSIGRRGGRAAARRARLPGAAHRAGPRARGPRPAGRDRARHGRRRAQPRDLPRPGRARRLDADDAPARLVPRRRALRARRARRGRAPRRHEHDRRRGLAAGRDHRDRRRDGAAARSAAPRRGSACRAAGRVAGACRAGCDGRGLHRRMGADLARSSRSRSTPT